MRDCFSYVLFKDCLKFCNTRAVSGLCCLASVVMFVLLVGLQEGGGSVGWNYFFYKSFNGLYLCIFEVGNYMT